MYISNKKLVTYHYQLSDANNQSLIESTYGSKAKQYIHGVSNMLKGLEESLSGKAKGDKFSVTLNPEQAYGAYNEEAIGRISLNYVSLPGGKAIRGKLQPGTLIEIRTDQGIFEGTVIKQGLKTIDVDANHPLAGKSLEFSIEVLDVRIPTAAELAEDEGCGNCSCCQ